MVTALFVL